MTVEFESNLIAVERINEYCDTPKEVELIEFESKVFQKFAHY
jgi:hypothetical protein